MSKQAFSDMLTAYRVRARPARAMMVNTSMRLQAAANRKPFMLGERVSDGDFQEVLIEQLDALDEMQKGAKS